jgi:hypothetical protein
LPLGLAPAPVAAAGLLLWALGLAPPVVAQRLWVLRREPPVAALLLPPRLAG